MENSQEEAVEFQIVPVNQEALGTYVKAEIDMQISTARAYPRSLKHFLSKVETIATISADVAESCTYALPRKQRNDKGQMETKVITGPSVRFAEIVVNSYGNIRSGARIIANDGRNITAQGMCHDLESNTLVVVEVKRKITNKQGQTFSEDMQTVTGNAACAIAFRNAVFKVVPSAIVEEVYEKVQEVAKGTAATLIARRAKALDYFRGLGVKDEAICEKLEVKGVEDIDLEKLQVLSGMKVALKNSETTLAELFPTDEQKEKAKLAADSTAGAMKNLTKTAAQKSGQQSSNK